MLAPHARVMGYRGRTGAAAVLIAILRLPLTLPV